jgi:hypothetical protein
LVAAILLGGGTSAGFLSDAILQLLAIPLLLACIWQLSALPSLRSVRWPLLFCAAVILVPVLQLIPLPPQVWTALPKRAAEAQAFELLGQPLPWMPVSVAPHATWLSALSLLPPVAIFLATLLIGYRERRAASLAVLAIGIVSAFVGLNQVAQGPDSPLRFFAFTNLTEAVGFFANRNHFAALLYTLTLLAAAWAVELAVSSEVGRQQRDAAWIVGLVASFTVLVVLVAAQAIARSRAGVILAIAALFGRWRLPCPTAVPPPASRRPGCLPAPPRSPSYSWSSTRCFASCSGSARTRWRTRASPLPATPLPPPRRSCRWARVWARSCPSMPCSRSRQTPWSTLTPTGPTTTCSSCGWKPVPQASA